VTILKGVNHFSIQRIVFPAEAKILILANDALSKFNSGRLPWQSAGNKQKKLTHFRTYSRRALCDPPKLCMVIELVVPITIGVIDFLIQRIVFPTGCTEKFGLIYRRAVSQQ